jgi:hypothetical protein
VNTAAAALQFQQKSALHAIRTKGQKSYDEENFASGVLGKMHAINKTASIFKTPGSAFSESRLL